MSDQEPESEIWKAAYRFGWAVLAIFAVFFGAMCAAGIFMITGER